MGNCQKIDEYLTDGITLQPTGLITSGKKYFHLSDLSFLYPLALFSTKNT